MRVAYPLRVFFDCSTEHLMPTTRAWLDAKSVSASSRNQAPIDAPSPTPFGWFLWAEQRPGTDVPPDLARVMRHARRRGAEYILFDADAPADPSLPTFS